MLAFPFRNHLHMIAYVIEGFFMSFDQRKYISHFNKETYKMFPIRVRKDNGLVIDKLNHVRNKNQYILGLIEKDVNPSILTLKQIKSAIMPVLASHGIREVYLFGSYARGEANNESDVDIYCESGDVASLLNQIDLEEELEKALGKEVDLIFIGSQMDGYFAEQLKGDLIKLC